MDDGGKSRGFGFVGFEDHESAQKVSHLQLRLFVVYSEDLLFHMVRLCVGSEQLVFAVQYCFVKEL